MINVRQNVFETNSSSSHSFSVNIETEGVLETIAPNSKGVITLKGGDFSRAEFYISFALEKANAIAVYCAANEDSKTREMFESVMMAHTGASSIEYEITFTGKKRSSISFTFEKYLRDVLGSKRDMKDFIFNRNSHIDAEFGYNG